MTASPKRLLVFPDLRSLESIEPSVREALESRFKLVVSDSPRRRPFDEGAALETISRLGEGVGLVEASGEILWMNNQLASASPEALRSFADACVRGLEELRSREHGCETSGSVRQAISTAEAAYEVVVAEVPGDGRDHAIGLMLDVTASRRLQERIEAVDAAGGELLDVDSRWVSQPVTSRLRRIEERLVAGIAAILPSPGKEFPFEVRLIDPRSGQLELVMSQGIDPLPIGQRLFARSDGQGISGLVAASGQGYVCRDAANDPNFLPGLAGAKSSVTVPIRRGEAVIGTLDVESTEVGRFDDEDRLCLELYARYLGLALTILDMLVVERYTTNRQVADNVLGELRTPLDTLSAVLAKLEAEGGVAAEAAPAIREAIASIEARLASSTSGPQSILGAEEFLRDAAIEASLAGRRVLVADDEPQIRQTIRAVLERRGCSVVVCEDGASAIEAIEASAKPGASCFELVISDVRMPDRNGYEVFRAAKEAHAETPVILMTGFGYDPHHSIVRSSQEGLHCFLFKPFQVSQLLEEVQKALAGSMNKG